MAGVTPIPAKLQVFADAINPSIRTVEQLQAALATQGLEAKPYTEAQYAQIGQLLELVGGELPATDTQMASGLTVRPQDLTNEQRADLFNGIHQWEQKLKLFNKEHAKFGDEVQLADKQHEIPDTVMGMLGYLDTQLKGHSGPHADAVRAKWADVLVKHAHDMLEEGNWVNDEASMFTPVHLKTGWVLPHLSPWLSVSSPVHKEALIRLETELLPNFTKECEGVDSITLPRKWRDSGRDISTWPEFAAEVRAPAEKLHAEIERTLQGTPASYRAYIAGFHDRALQGLARVSLRTDEDWIPFHGDEQHFVVPPEDLNRLKLGE